jgi:hypothetical protein
MMLRGFLPRPQANSGFNHPQGAIHQQEPQMSAVNKNSPAVARRRMDGNSIKC